MRKTEVKAMAKDLFLKHGLEWDLGFDQAKRRLGACHFDKKRISLSERYIKIATPEQIINTLLHEIAHALVGVGHGHNHIWRRTAQTIGCDGSRVSSIACFTPPKWVADCKCGIGHNRYKKPKAGCKWSCAKCGTILEWRKP